MRPVIKCLCWGAATLAFLIGLPIAALLGRDAYIKTKQESYYREHPLLRDFHLAATDVDGSVLTQSPGPARVLQTQIPPGTSAADVFGKLNQEGFDCAWARGKSQRIVCGPNKTAREDHFVPRWRIELTLDEKRRFSDGSVVMLK